MQYVSNMFFGTNSDGEEDGQPRDEESGSYTSVQLPKKMTQSEIMSMAMMDLAPDRMREVLNSIDGRCREEGSVALRLDDIDKIIWTDHVFLNNGKHPFLKKIEKENSTSMEFMLSHENGNSPISKCLRDILPQDLEKTDQNVWIMEVLITEMLCDFPEPLEMKIDSPDSDWIVWTPVSYIDRIYKFTTQWNTMINRSVSTEVDKITIPRNRIWALYAAGIDLDSMMTKLDDNTVFLERNLSTVIIMETLRSSLTLPDEMRRHLDACALRSDSKRFKLPLLFYQKIKDTVAESLKTTRLADLKFLFKRFDEKKWIDDKDAVVTLNIQLKFAVFYRIFPSHEESGEVDRWMNLQ